MINIPHHFPAASPESPAQLAAMQSLTQSCGAGTAATVIASTAEIIKAMIFILLRFCGSSISYVYFVGSCAENGVDKEEKVGVNTRFLCFVLAARN